jgi:hypothetical protein
VIFDDDNQTRRALHAVADEPAPPAVTTADQVIRQGRRRALVQRGAAIASAVAVVAAIGVGGVALRSAMGGEGIGPATAPVTTAPSSTSVPRTAPTTKTTTQTQHPPSSVPVTPTAALLPGWQWVDYAMAGDPKSRCIAPAAHLPAERVLELPSQDVVETELSLAIARASGLLSEVTEIDWAAHAPPTGAPRGYLELTLPVADGPAVARLEVAGYGGDPAEAADADVAAYDNCLAPSRTTLDDGTVLQLYQPDRYLSAEGPVQHLRIYQPNGRRYALSTADLATNGDYTNVNGRLPLDDSQLVEVAESLVALGK